MSSVSLLCDKDESILSLGGPDEYVLGRGPLVKIIDKRVSRNHALLCLQEDGTVKICLKHDNPFFYKSTKEDKFVILSKNEWRTVKDGDKISFLPNELIYTIKIITLPERNKDITQNDDPPTQTDQTVGINKNGMLPVSDSSEHSLSQSSSVGGSSGRKRNLPSWMKGVSITASVKNKVKKRKLSTAIEEMVEPPPQLPDIPSSVTKLPVSDSTDDNTMTKKANKDKPASVVSEKVSASTEDSSGSVDDKKKLPSCPYGKKCYRKNPAHLNEYSHDDKSDEEEEGDKPECPFGTSCYRHNPLHREQFKHTASPATTVSSKKKRVRTSTRSKKPKPSVLSGVSDDEGEPNTYDYNDLFIDDEEDVGSCSSSTSFKDDSEDDDWCLPEHDSENITELVSEANSFVTNKKMHRTS